MPLYPKVEEQMAKANKIQNAADKIERPLDLLGEAEHLISDLYGLLGIDGHETDAKIIRARVSANQALKALHEAQKDFEAAAFSQMADSIKKALTYLGYHLEEKTYCSDHPDLSIQFDNIPREIRESEGIGDPCDLCIGCAAQQTLEDPNGHKHPLVILIEARVHADIPEGKEVPF